MAIFPIIKNASNLNHYNHSIILWLLLITCGFMNCNAFFIGIYVLLIIYLNIQVYIMDLPVYWRILLI